MIRKTLLIGAVLVLSLLLTVPAFARGEGNPHKQVKIYVTGQGLVYDSIVTNTWSCSNPIICWKLPF